jgi:protein TonB
MKLPAAISLAIHTTLVLVFLIGARFRPTGMADGFGPGDFTPVTIVDLKELPAMAAPARQAEEVPPAPVPPAPKPMKAVPPDLKPEKEKGIKIPDEPKPDKPAKPAKPDTTVAAAATEATQPTRAPATPAPPASDPAAAALAGVPEATVAQGGGVTAGIEGGGGGGGGGGGFGDYAYYRIAMQNKIAANWSPGFISGEAICIVYFRIIRSGLVVGARVEESSGIPFYDQTALRAVLESSPLPPLPAQFPEDAVGVHFRFRYQP